MFNFPWNVIIPPVGYSEQNCCINCTSTFKAVGGLHRRCCPARRAIMWSCHWNSRGARVISSDLSAGTLASPFTRGFLLLRAGIFHRLFLKLPICSTSSWQTPPFLLLSQCSFSVQKRPPFFGTHWAFSQITICRGGLWINIRHKPYFGHDRTLAASSAGSRAVACMRRLSHSTWFLLRLTSSVLLQAVQRALGVTLPQSLGMLSTTPKLACEQQIHFYRRVHVLVTTLALFS